MSLDFALLSLAFVAGTISFLNPCGIAMLPTYISLYLGSADKHKNDKMIKSFSRGIKMGIIISAGFLAVFVPFGILLSLIGKSLVAYAFYLNFPIAVFLIAIGAIMLLGKNLSFDVAGKISLLRTFNPASELGGKSMLTYGVLYATVSLGCTLPVFITVVLIALSSGGFFAASINFLSYSLGMATFMIAVSISLATSKEFLVKKMEKIIPYVKTASSVIIILAGLYLAYRTVLYLLV